MHSKSRLWQAQKAKSLDLPASNLLKKQLAKCCTHTKDYSFGIYECLICAFAATRRISNSRPFRAIH